MRQLVLSMLMALVTISVQAQYKVGDIYNKNGVKGMVVVVDETGQHGLIMSLEHSKNVEWVASEEQNLSTAAFHEDDGMKNMSAIENYIKDNSLSWDNFPAFAWARSLGDGWYIPASEELIRIWTNLNGGNLNLNNKAKQSWKKYSKILKNNDGDKLTGGVTGIMTGGKEVLRGMISSTETDGGGENNGNKCFWKAYGF